MIKLLKPKFWLGLSAITIVLTMAVYAGQSLSKTYENLINDQLGLTTQRIDKIEVNDDVEGSAYVEEDGSMSDATWERLLDDEYAWCQDAVEQGAVLLKNALVDGEPTLPLKSSERKVTLFGRASRNLYTRSGAGGAAPNDGSEGTPDITIYSLDGVFTEAGFDINETVFSQYNALSRSGGSAEMSNANSTIEIQSSVYTDEVKASFAEYNDAAIVTFARVGTENTDPGDKKLNLDQREADLLNIIAESGQYDKTIVIINSPMPMSMDFIDQEQYGIDAAIWMGVPGYYGAAGVVHLLTGEDDEGNPVNPSGHCPDTFAASASSSPAYVNFNRDGNAGSAIAVYAEGVYVGYKYYETRYYDAILGQGEADGDAGTFCSEGGWNYAEEMGYPFGYGMSYTTYDQKIKDIIYHPETDRIEVEVEVKNTGNLDGKASIQVYVNAPYTDHDKENGLGKSAIALMGYEKVDVKAGETVTKSVFFDRYFLCTYDYVDYKTYILEGGTYNFALGNGAHEAINNVIGKTHPGEFNLYDHNGEHYEPNLDAVKSMVIEEDLEKYSVSHYNPDVEVHNQFDDADYNNVARENGKNEITYLDRQDWQGTWPTKITSNPATSAQKNMRQYYSKTEDTPSYAAGDGENYNVPYVDETGKTVKITFTDMADVPLEGTIEKGKFAGKEGADIWDAFIKQMNLDDLCISVSDNRGILDVLKVMKMGNSIAEGPEGLLAKYQYGDHRWATGFPTGPVYTASWDHAVQQQFGAFFGEDALYCGVAAVNAPGANINRTPYGSRASEYMSEDGVMNYNVATNIIGAARRKGLIMNIKHCFLNNQETARQGISTFCNEQAIREIYLKPFEGALTRGRGLGIMTSYNRIGVRYAACHEPLMKNVMREEWNYKGYIIDDALTGSNTSDYSNGPAMLYCGTDVFCLDGNRGGQLKQWVTQNDDGTILECLQRANKNIMYSISRSWMGGLRISEKEMEEEIEKNTNPLWKQAVNGITIGTTTLMGIVLGVTAFAVVFDIISRRKKGSEPAAPTDGAAE